MKINEMNDEEIHRLCNLFYKLIFIFTVTHIKKFPKFSILPIQSFLSRHKFLGLVGLRQTNNLRIAQLIVLLTLSCIML